MKTYKWLLIAMLSCAFFFHQADRALFGLLTIPIQKDIGLTDVQVGWINTTLSWTLAAMTVVAGFVGDRVQPSENGRLKFIYYHLLPLGEEYLREMTGLYRQFDRDISAMLADYTDQKEGL